MANLQGEYGHSILDSIGISSFVGIEGASELSAEAYDGVTSIVKTVSPTAQILRDDQVDTTLVSLVSNELPSEMQNEYCVPNFSSESKS